MGLVLGWIRAALGHTPAEDHLVTEIYRRVANDCPSWLRAAPLSLQLKSLTVIALLQHSRSQSA